MFAFTPDKLMFQLMAILDQELTNDKMDRKGIIR
jgi:hypothetical protein